MMMNSGARRGGLVVLSAESAERSTPYLCQIFDVTWLLCHPDLSGLRIYDPVLESPTGFGVNFSRGGRFYRLRLGRLVALGEVDCSWQSAVLTPTSAQLRANRMMVLMTIGWTGCAWADCWPSVWLIAFEPSAVRLPGSAQLQPNRSILVLKGCFRLGEPTRVPIPRQPPRAPSSHWEKRTSGRHPLVPSSAFPVAGNCNSPKVNLHFTM